MKPSTILLQLLLLIALNLNGQQSIPHQCYLFDENSIPREREVDFTHLEASLKFNLEQGKIAGTVTHHFKVIRQSVDSVLLDAPSIIINQVSLDGKPARYAQREGTLILYSSSKLTLNSAHQLDIAYEAHPKKGMYFIGWKDTTASIRKQIWTQGQGIDNRHWLPMFDEMSDKITTDITITFDSKYAVISNGELKSKKSKDGMTTWRFIMEKPHAPYLIMIAIGDYKMKELKSASGTPLKLYYYPDWEDRFNATYQGSVEVFNYFEQLIGIPYPWGTYSQVPVQDFLYGAMENTSATIFGDFFFVDERGMLDANYVFVNAHELAHQWFGDLVTSRSPHAHWLHESFATYFHTLWERKYFGENHFKLLMHNNAKSCLQASSKDQFPIVHSKAGSTRHYLKGAWVLNMLKEVVGDTIFYDVIKAYTLENAYKNVDTEDLLTAFHEHAGLSLNWFWDQWILKGGEPHFEVKWVSTNSNGAQQTHLTVNQIHVQDDVVGLFKVPVDIEIHYTNSSVAKHRIWIDAQNETFIFNGSENSEVKCVIFDANDLVLNQLTFERSYQQLVDEIELASFDINKLQALEALAAFPMYEKRDFLARVASNKNYAWWVRAEALKQLQLSADPLSWEPIKQFAFSGEPGLKKSILRYTATIPEALLADYENMLSDSSYEVIATALKKLCTQYPDRAEGYLKATENVYGVRSNNVRLAWLEMQITRNTKPEYIAELIKYTAYGVDFNTRIEAAELLKSFQILTAEAALNLMDGAANPNDKLSRAFGDVLKFYFGQALFRPIVLEAYVTLSDDFSKARVAKYLK